MQPWTTTRIPDVTTYEPEPDPIADDEDLFAGIDDDRLTYPDGTPLRLGAVVEEALNRRLDDADMVMAQHAAIARLTR